MLAAALARSRPPRSIPWTARSCLRGWLAASLGRRAKDAPDAATPVVEISPPDVGKRRSVPCPPRCGGGRPAYPLGQGRNSLLRTPLPAGRVRAKGCATTVRPSCQRIA